MSDRWQPAGACWHQAAVQAGSCFNILKDRRRLALAFTNCHLEESERPMAPSPSQMSDATFAIYTEFYTHTADLCFHLQGEHYQLRAQDALARLSGHAEHWLLAIEWIQAVGSWMVGATVIWAMGHAAKWLDVPKAKQATLAAQGMHAVWHLATPALGVAVALAVAIALKPGTPKPVEPVEPVESLVQIEPKVALVARRSSRRVASRRGM